MSTEAEGKPWSANTSSAKDYKPPLSTSSHSSASLKSKGSDSNVSSYYGGGAQDSFQNSDSGANKRYVSASTAHLPSDARYQGFGNPNYQAQPKRDNGDFLAGAMSSLSVGWSMLSKGATTAADMAKDITSHAGQKASELAERDGAGLLSGIGSLASKASEVGKTSWGGLSGFVKSPSLQGFSSGFSKGFVELSTALTTPA